MTAKSHLRLPLSFWQKIWRLLLLEGTGVTRNPCNNDMYFMSSPAYTIGIDLMTEAEPALLASFSFAVALLFCLEDLPEITLENKVTVIFSL